MHSFTLSTNGGYTLWIGANPDATGGFGVRGRHPRLGHRQRRLRGQPGHDADARGGLVRRAPPAAVAGPGAGQVRLPHVVGPRSAEERAAGTDRAGPQDRLLRQAPRPGRQGPHRRRPATTPGPSRCGTTSTGGWAASPSSLRPGDAAPRPRSPLLLVAFWIVFHITLVHGEPRYMLSVTPLVAPALAWLLVGGARRLAGILPKRRGGLTRRRGPRRQVSSPISSACCGNSRTSALALGQLEVGVVEAGRDDAGDQCPSPACRSQARLGRPATLRPARPPAARTPRPGAGRRPLAPRRHRGVTTSGRPAAPSAADSMTSSTAAPA